MIKSEETEVDRQPRSLAPARPLASEILRDGRAREEMPLGGGDTPFSVLHHGIGVVGRGATPQMAEAHGGRGGVGIRVLLPCVAAVPPVMHTPVYILMSGYGLVKPSESVWRKATIWFSSVSVKPSLPIVMSRLLGTSGIGQQSTFSVFPAGQFPEVTAKGYTSLVL